MSSIPRPYDSWTAQVRRQAYVAVKIAAARHKPGGHALAYFVRRAIAHGLTTAEVCQAGDLNEATVLQLSDPSDVAA